ncbi:hypothetical protein J9303_01750 [Bacillaceae bacterium Marseille-Q3522]|nr:hypothetical protein [Bacillaceae bacterium Marseille-Q3522]
MRKILPNVLIIIILLIGGCGSDMQQGDGKKRTDTIAFKDDFTRDFIEAAEEVEEGYYQFRSATNGYTMLFPVNAEIASVSYEKTADAFESFSFGEQVEDENLSYYYMITYEDRPITNNIEINLKSLSRYANYDGDYERFEHDGKTYYYATDLFKSEKRDNYKYFAYIKSNNSDKALNYYASSTCTKVDKECVANSKEIEQRFVMLMKSVDFLDNN